MIASMWSFTERFIPTKASKSTKPRILSRYSFILRYSFLVIWNKVLYHEILARIWEAKYTSNVFQIWKADSQFTHLERTHSNIDERSQETKRWSCCSQSRKSWFTIPRDRSSELRNFNGGSRAPMTKCWRLWPRIAKKIYFLHIRKLWFSSLTKVEWLNKIGTK